MIDFNQDSQGTLHFHHNLLVAEALASKFNEAESVLCLASDKGGLQLPESAAVMARHPYAHLLVAYRKGLASARELGDSPLALSKLSIKDIDAISLGRLLVAQDHRLLPTQDTRQQSFALVPVDASSEARFHANLARLSVTLGSSWSEFIGILRTITFVDVASMPGLPYFSGSWNLTFGAMHMVHSESLPILAECITHEAAHTWLSLVDDNDRLARNMWDEASHWVSPWREDPRPIGGVVHGTFVFSCVLMALNKLLAKAADKADAEQIRKRIARIASGVMDGLEVLRGSGLLTEAGEKLCRDSEARLNATLPAVSNEWTEVRAVSRALHLKKIDALRARTGKSNARL